jgi:hypothetical protein
MKLHEKVEQYFEKYKDYMEFYESKSTIAKTRGVTNEDLFALGTQLEQYDNFQEFSESNGGYGDLGVLPNIALDVITASTAQSPIPLFASIQPLQEQQGTIYFKNVVAETTRGGVTDNDKLVDPIHGRVKRTTQFAGEEISGEVLGNADGSTTAFSGSVAYAPIRKREVEVHFEVGGTAGKLIDDGQGNLIGVGGSGVVNYEDGTISVNFLNAPDAGDITLTYATNFEALTEIPTIRSEFDSLPVRAKTYALRSDVGLFKSYSLGKRFGINIEETMAKDLTQELTTEVASNVVMTAYLASTGNTDWSKTAPSGISFTEHKLTFFDALAYAESEILSNAGRSGGASALIAGHQATALIRTLPGFKPAGDLNAVLGTHFFGTLDGRPVLRSSVMPDSEIIMVSKGTSMFDTSVVYAPYLPLFVTNMSDGIDHNPLKSQKGVALQAGMLAPVPTLITKITIVA